ncbi:hypothetical protein V3C99_011077 [Haemonchus contortus]
METTSDSSQIFPDGSITKIVYHNFLTYDDVECKPGPNLNMFIGTNGAGKSTVICGICLAVGGNPKILGRSERMGDYIKHKRDEGFVEVYMWIDNPCTFLAQDKVKSFSEQSPVDLLMNTERAGNPSLLEQHEELIRKKKHESVHIEKAREVENRLQSIEGEIAMLLPRVENYKKKEFLRTKIKILQKKKAILDYKESKERFAVEEAAVDQVQAAVKNTEKKIKKLRTKIEKEQEREKDYLTRQNNILRQTRGISDEVDALTNINLYADKVRDATERFNRLKKQNDSWEQEMDSIRKQVDRVRENVSAAKEEMKGYEEFKRETAQKTQQHAEEDDRLCKTEEGLQAEERKLNSEKMKLRDEARRIDQVMEGRVRILENLRSNMADEAWRWYQANRDKFRHPVYVPILHMTVPDAKTAMLLENLIAVRDLPMFIFGCKEDETLLTDRRHNWKLNSTVVPPSQVNLSALSTTVTQEMKGFGFTRFAVDLFTAPDVVKQYLCNVARLHQVPIGSARSNDLYDEIKSAFTNTPYKLYLTDRYRVQFTVSKYGSHEVIGQQSELRSPARLFVAHTSSLDDKSKFEEERQRIRACEKELSDRRSQVSQKRASIQKEREALKAKQAEWRTKRDELTNLERSLSNRENKLEMLSANRPNIDQARAALKETKVLASKEALETVLKILQKLEKLRKMNVEETLLRLALKGLRESLSEVEQQVLAVEEKLQEELTLMEGRLTVFRSAKEDLGRVAENLYEYCGLKTLEESEMTVEEKEIPKQLEKLFADENIPDDRSAVLRLLEEEKVKLNIASVDGSKEDVDRCERLKQEKVILLDRKVQQEITREAWKANLTKEIMEWREPVESLIRKINVNYSKFFATLGCAGEVYLEIPEDPLNIDGYGIMIMVSFRNGERLRRLDHQVQSGGERSVSTMLYLLALQELCPVPFRCVDEINQGMDPVNERKVFSIMVGTLSGEGNLAKTQYFLLTPKLLHGLKFNRKVTVQIVHNGATLSENCHEWDVRNFLSIMKSRVAS